MKSGLEFQPTFCKEFQLILDFFPRSTNMWVDECETLGKII